MKLLSKSLFVFALSAFVACKKDSTTLMISLTGTDSGKTISVSKGEAIVLTLNNPGDGGYQFIAPVYNSSILILNNHTNKAPANINSAGGFGQDIWKFTSLATGTTLLKISASRGGIIRDTISQFSSQIMVK